MIRFREKIAIFCVLLSGVMAACGDGGQDNRCEKLTNTCSTEGIHQCTPDKKGRQICEKNKDGCLVWSQARACGERQECAASGIDAACRCKNECPQQGLTKCHGNGEVIDECSKDAYGCLFWKSGTDCAQEDKFCNESAQGAACAVTCQDKCELGKLRCVSNWLQGCVKLGQCTDWQNSVNCADKNQMCSEVTGQPGCYAVCQDECDTAGAARCQGKHIQTCKRDGDADICLEWVNTTDCTANNRPTDTCNLIDGTPTCVCTDECPANGVNKCQQHDLWTCAADGDADGCLEWKFAANCRTTERPTDICEEANNTAACVCTNECPASDAKRCVQNTLQICAEDGDADKCLEWKFSADCTQGGASTDICQVVNNVAQCVCVDECSPANALRCDAQFKWVQKCSADGDQDACLEWKNHQDCTQLGSTGSCSSQGGAQCVLGCTDDCAEQELGQKRCGQQGQSQVIEECRLAANGCRQWVTLTTCTGDTPTCDATQNPPLCIGSCREVVIQPRFYNLPFVPIIPSQDFTETNYNPYDIFAADDVTFTTDTQITTIYVSGICYGGGTTLNNATNLVFAIFPNQSGVPGGTPPAVTSAVWSLTVPPSNPQVTLLQDIATGNSCSVLLRPSTPINISAGTYWFAFWPHMSLGTGKQFGWLFASTQNQSIAKVVNPGGGWAQNIGVPFPTTWGSVDLVYDYHDLAFSLWQGSNCCANECAPVGTTSCHPTEEKIRLCRRGQPQCGLSGYQWQVTAATCAEPNSACDDSSGAATCVPPITCANDIGNATGAAVASGDNTNAQDNYQGWCAGDVGGKDVCFTWTAPDTRTYVFDTLNSTLSDTVLYAIRGVRQIACNDDISSSQYRSRITLSLTAGQKIILIVDGYDANSVGPFVLNITPQ